MKKRVNKLVFGAVLEVLVDVRFAYMQYIARHTLYGDAVFVGSKLYNEKAIIKSDLFLEGYFTFYPVKAAVKHKLISVVGHLPSASLPKRFRRPGAIVGRQVKTWIIDDDDGGLTVKSSLSEDDLRLPIASIWNHEYLVHRLAENWDPLQEGRTS